MNGLLRLDNDPCPPVNHHSSHPHDRHAFIRPHANYACLLELKNYENGGFSFLVGIVQTVRS